MIFFRNIRVLAFIFSLMIHSVGFIVLVRGWGLWIFPFLVVIAQFVVKRLFIWNYIDIVAENQYLSSLFCFVDL